MTRLFERLAPWHGSKTDDKLAIIFAVNFLAGDDGAALALADYVQEQGENIDSAAWVQRLFSCRTWFRYSATPEQRRQFFEDAAAAGFWDRKRKPRFRDRKFRKAKAQ